MDCYNKSEYTTNIERIFKVTREENVVDLSKSLSIVNRIASAVNFENEIFSLTFIACIGGVLKCFSMCVIANECIDFHYCTQLKEQLGITIEGSGMLFEIRNYLHDFLIVFDSSNSVFINTETVKNGWVHFRK
ncbi:hypothetical protein [Tenacibaculum sp. MAR_2009_124]|uniref:hypothetical protein n=1 Tax=Tenacibaculum sp. MAR_2009_124 TaxID=1250059 RepID=UPI00115FB4BC|nr:hypothetical protein [Tenacibaculum sp. MAR_2009_124]